MKTNFKKPLTRNEMKQINGGKLTGCAMQGQKAVAYMDGCCTGLIACTDVEHTCEPDTTQCP